MTRLNFESIATELNVDPMNYRGVPIYQPRYNLSPTNILPILMLQRWERQISPMSWGAIPKNRCGTVNNWRSESFPPRASRCGVITDGFYEWSGPKEAGCRLGSIGQIMRWSALAGMWKMQLRRDGTLVVNPDYPGEFYSGADSRCRAWSQRYAPAILNSLVPDRALTQARKPLN